MSDYSLEKKVSSNSSIDLGNQIALSKRISSSNPIYDEDGSLREGVISKKSVRLFQRQDGIVEATESVLLTSFEWENTLGTKLLGYENNINFLNFLMGSNCRFILYLNFGNIALFGGITGTFFDSSSPYTYLNLLLLLNIFNTVALYLQVDLLIAKRIVYKFKFIVNVTLGLLLALGYGVIFKWDLRMVSGVLIGLFIPLLVLMDCISPFTQQQFSLRLATMGAVTMILLYSFIIIRLELVPNMNNDPWQFDMSWTGLEHLQEGPVEWFPIQLVSELLLAKIVLSGNDCLHAYRYENSVALNITTPVKILHRSAVCCRYPKANEKRMGSSSKTLRQNSTLNKVEEVQGENISISDDENHTPQLANTSV